MKAERRHELQQNTLDQALTRAPEVARRYGGMILLIVLAAVVGYMLIRYRISSARDAHRIATENLATARTSINQLAQLHLYPIPPQQILDLRKRWADDARLAIDSITATASEPKLLAEALLAKGDLNWALAQMDEPPAAATQPALRLETDQKTLLSEAESAYQQVLTEHGDQKQAVVGAHFGLAAVYESTGDWNEAKQMYEEITKDESVAEAFRQQARFRLEQASEWSRPVLIAAATQPAPPTGVPFLNAPGTPATATAPATGETKTQPATTTQPATAPATQALEQ